MVLGVEIWLFVESQFEIEEKEREYATTPPECEWLKTDEEEEILLFVEEQFEIEEKVETAEAIPPE